MSPTAHNQAMYRHVVFDLGGTLIDTYPELDAALMEVVALGGGEVTREQVETLTRQSTATAIAGLSERFGIPAAHFEAANTALKRRWRDSPPPAMPGARAVMDLVAANGGRNLVVTHRDRDSATSLLEQLGLVPDDLVCPGDGFPRKPDPTMHRVIAQRHGLDPADCVGVGDRPIDAQAARAAGMAAAVLEVPGVDNDTVAEHRLGSMADLLALLTATAR